MKVLTQHIRNYQESFRDKVPEATQQVMAKATQELVQTGIAEKALQTGASFPSVTLPDQNGKDFALSDVLGKKPLVISFYRGGWCPYCNLQLKVYQEHLAEIQAAGAELIAITPELPDNSLTTAEKNHLSFTVLSDASNAFAEKLGLSFRLAPVLEPIYAEFGIDIPAHNGNQDFTLPLPATYIIDKEGTIIWDFIDADYTKRAEIEDILEVLKGL